MVFIFRANHGLSVTKFSQRQYVTIYTPRPRIYVCAYGELTVVQSIMIHTRCGHGFLDPSPASGRGSEVLSGKNDTTRMTIAVLTGTSWILSKSLGIRKPKCGCVCVQVIYFEETKIKKKQKKI